VNTIPVLVVEGLVYSDETLLCCERDGLSEVIDLTPFEGTSIYGVVAHVPSNQRKATWGLGSCYLEATGACPFGHREDPTKLLLWKETGVFRREGGWWTVGGLPFPSRETLVGHWCKIFLCPSSIEPSGSTEGLGDQVRSLTEILAKLKKPR